MEKKNLNHKGKTYEYFMQDEEFHGEKVVRIICKSAGIDQVFLLEDLDLAISEILPDCINFIEKDKEKEILEIQLTRFDKTRLKKLAKKEKLSMEEFILKKTLG